MIADMERRVKNSYNINNDHVVEIRLYVPDVVFRCGESGKLGSLVFSPLSAINPKSLIMRKTKGITPCSAEAQLGTLTLTMGINGNGALQALKGFKFASQLNSLNYAFI